MNNLYNNIIINVKKREKGLSSPRRKVRVKSYDEKKSRGGSNFLWGASFLNI